MWFFLTKDSERTNVARDNSCVYTSDMTEETGSDFYSTEEVAKVLGVSPRRVQQLAGEGLIEGERHGRVWRLAKWSVHRYLEEHGPGRPRVPRLDRERAASSDEVRELREQIGELREELGRLRGRAELEEITRSTLDEQLRRERERADRLEEEAHRLREELVAAMSQSKQQEAPQQVQEGAEEPPQREAGVEERETVSRPWWRRIFGT